jgi:hypothetical protein
MRELEGKAAGDERAFIPSTAPGWQIGRLRHHTLPDAAGGEGGHGAARPEGIIHRYVFNHLYYLLRSCWDPSCNNVR